MSAIYGVINWEAPVCASEPTTMGRRLQHRATEPPKLWSTPVAVLGHLGLPTTPSSKLGAGLHHEPHAGITVTVDARLEDRDSLAARLDMSPHCSDAALIAAAYSKWNDAFLQKLRGDFALALWDEKHRRLLLARDTFGVKPLYYQTESKGVKFASEPKAMIHAGSEMNPLRLAEFHQSLPPSGTHTFWRHIECLEPGTVVSFSPTTCRVWRFDDLLFSPANAGQLPKADFREIFLHAIKTRLERVGTLACMLSGGIDSSAISAAAASIEQPARTISNVFPEYCTDCDERIYIESLLNRGNFQPQWVAINQSGSFERLVSLVHQQGEPFAGFGMFSCGSLYEAARERGITIMLDGHGGDEVVTGTDWWLGSLLRRREWLALLTAARERSLVFQEPYLLPCFKAMMRTYLVHTWPLSRVTALMRRASNSLKAPAAEVQAEDIFQLEHLRLAPNYTPAKPKNPYASARSDAEAHQRLVQTSVRFRYLDELDRASAAHQVEARYPFFDRNVVAYCIAAEPEEKFKNGWPRAIVRNALAGLLPESIRFRTSKTDFKNPLLNSIRGISRDLWDSLSRQPEAESLINKKTFGAAVRTLHEHPEPDPKLVQSLWTALVSFVWLHERRRLCTG